MVPQRYNNKLEAEYMISIKTCPGLYSIYDASTIMSPLDIARNTVRKVASKYKVCVVDLAYNAR